MDLRKLQNNWNSLGQEDPFWAILSHPAKKGGKWDQNEFYKVGENDISQLMKRVECLTKELPRMKALDFGCGAGRLTQPLCQYFEQCVGIDIAPSMIALATKNNRYGNKCKYLLNETNDLNQFKDNQFNFIITFITLQHMVPEYSKNYIKELLRVLAPAGLLVFQIPSEFNRNAYEEMLKDSNSSNRLKRVASSVFQWVNQQFRKSSTVVTDIKDTASLIEMYAVPKQDVLQLIKENDGKLMDVHEDTWSGREWFSFTYYVTK